MVLDPSTWDKNAREAFERYQAFLNGNPEKYASEIATIERLKESEVTYVLRLDSSGSDIVQGREGAVTTDGTTIFITLANQGNDHEQFSMNSRLGHEFEHARQFDNGEWGFASNEKGNFMEDGKFVGSTFGYDITDEIKAWEVSVRLATPRDMNVMGGNPNLSTQFPILDLFSRSRDKAGVLKRMGGEYSRLSNTAESVQLAGVDRGKWATPSSNVRLQTGRGLRKVFARNGTP
jgi:hypothetical protein